MGRTVWNIGVGRTRSRNGFTVVVGLVLLLILIRFVSGSLIAVYDNWNSDRADQGAFLQLGLNVHDKPLHVDPVDDPLYPLLYASFGERDGFVTDGARSPLFPLILSSFAERTWDYFTWAKLLNVAFGTLVLILLFLIVRYHLDTSTAILATGLLAVNGSFVRHSALVISEPLLMVFILLAWHFTALGFRRSKFWALAGLFAGLAFLAKGSAPALVASFIVSVVVVRGTRAVKNVSWLLYLLAFFVVAVPYLAYNTQVFGAPLYNFNYTHAVWMTNSYDAHQTGVLPTMGSYLSSHSLSEIAAREWRGLVMTKNLLAYALPSQGLARFFESIYATLGLATAVTLLVLFRKRVKQFVQAHTEFAVSAGALAAALLLPSPGTSRSVPISVTSCLLSPYCWLSSLQVSWAFAGGYLSA